MQLGQYAARALKLLRNKKMFWRILLLYLAGSVLVLSVFSVVITRLLTQHATNDAIDHSRDTLVQAYTSVNYALNTTYETYYKLYQSYTASDLMFSSTVTPEDTLAVGELFRSLNTASDCVDSVYLINRAVDRVYTSDGGIYSLDDFYDTQALWLFQFYNEHSDTLFLPRIATFSQAEGSSQHNFISLIFARKNAVMIPMGGIIVNIDETKLINMITKDLESPETLYVISENGSILANADTSLVNTSIYGSRLWKQLQQYAGQEDFSFHVDFDGQRCLVTGRNAPRLRFFFLSITPVAQFEKNISFIRNLILNYSAIFLILTLVISAATARYIYRPISHLVTNLRRRRSSEDSASPSPSQDEVTFLNNAYETLFDEVASLSRDNSLMSRDKTRDVVVRLLFGEYPTEQICREEAEKQGIDPDAASYLTLVFLFDGYEALTPAATTPRMWPCCDMPCATLPRS